MNYKIEKIGGSIEVCVSPAHTIMTDSFLLSYFAAPKQIDTAVDLCSGCGIVPLLWMRGPESAPKKAYAVEVQDQAVMQAEESIRRSGLGCRLEVLHTDLCELKLLPEGKMADLVTCNPPYKAPDTGLVSASESSRVARHETLCSLDDICACAARLLRFGGRFSLCQLPERLVDVLETMRRHKIEPKRIRFVQKEADTAPWLFLVEGKRGAKPFLQVEQPLVLHRNGDISMEMQVIYKDYRKV